MKRKTVYSLIVVLSLMTITTNVYAAQKDLIGDWSVTFEGYYGNNQVGTSYGEVNMTFYITNQTERSFSGTVEVESEPGSQYCLTGNIKNNKIVIIIGGNTFIRGKVKGTIMDLVMETQQMSDNDTQGVLYGIASKK